MRNRIRLVPHGTDKQHLRPPSARERRDARAKFGLTPDDKVVGVIARMDPVKGQDMLLKSRKVALNYIRTTRPFCIYDHLGIREIGERV
jgi:glycosyltransferase involved in cell wall biosynthesis